VAARKRPAAACELNPEVPAEVSALVGRAMAWAPADRYPSAAALARELQRQIRAVLLADTATCPPLSPGPAARDESVSKLPPVELLPLETAEEAWRPKLKWIAAAAGLVLGLLLLAAVLHALFGPPPPPPSKGMVYVEAGYARLGDDESKLRKFLSGYRTDSELDKALVLLRQEPQRRVKVPAFWIDAYEVTNAEYARSLEATGRSPPGYWKAGKPPPGKGDHPVVDVTYEDAEAYAQWAGKKLPTREQWMRAYRGDNDWLFPWGDEYNAGRANVGDNPKYDTTSPVRDTPEDITPFKVHNMMGNASEFIRGTFSYRGEMWRVGKGAEFKLPGFRYGIGSAQFLYGLDTTDRGVGFRCVREGPGP
jgi:formylglycine-generating enzyme required for sulfatase activity